MKTAKLECHNCGASLAVTHTGQFIECQFCKTPYRVEWDNPCGPSLTVLEATIREIGTGLRAINSKTTALLGIHRKIVDKENARLALQEVKQRHKKRMSEIETHRRRLKEELNSGIAWHDSKCSSEMIDGIKMGFLLIVLMLFTILWGMSRGFMRASYVVVAGCPIMIGILVYRVKKSRRKRFEFERDIGKKRRLLEKERNATEIGYQRERIPLEDLIQEKIDL